MRLEHLRIIEDEACDLNDLITDALETLPKEDLVVIYNDYTTVNNYAPIYLNTEENLNRLLSEGKRCTPSFNKDFAFLTCNRYGGIESVDDLSKHAGLKEEIAPFVSDSIDKYVDVFLKDVEIDKAWLERHLPRTGLITRRQYVERVEDIANVVRYENEELAEKIHGIANKIRKTGKAYKLSEASKELMDLFDEYYKGTGKKERGEPLEGKELKKAQNMIWEKYQQEYPDTTEFDDLPNNVKNLYKKFFYTSAVKNLPQFLNSQLGLGAKTNEEAMTKELEWTSILEDYKDLIDQYQKNPKTTNFVTPYLNQLRKEFYQGNRDEFAVRAFLKTIISMAKKMERELHLSESVINLVRSEWKDLGDGFLKTKEKELEKMAEPIKSASAAEEIAKKFNATLITFFDHVKESIPEIYEEIGSNQKWTVENIKHSIELYLIHLLKNGTINSFINKVNKEGKISPNFFKLEISQDEDLKKSDDKSKEEEVDLEELNKSEDKTPPSAQSAEEEKNESSNPSEADKKAKEEEFYSVQ